MKLDHSYTTPPSREFLMEIAREKNVTPLPLINERYGLRLPPERFCLTASNLQLKKTNKDQTNKEKYVNTTSTRCEIDLESISQPLMDDISPLNKEYASTTPINTPTPATPTVATQFERATSSQSQSYSAVVPQTISTSVQESMRALKRKHDQDDADDDYDSDNYD